MPSKALQIELLPTFGFPTIATRMPSLVVFGASGTIFTIHSRISPTPRRCSNEAAFSHEVTKTDEIKTTNEKRVEVFGIEFDWVLSTSEGEEFLQQLSETENLGFFEIDVVKHIIMFQWSYFLPKIIIYLFTPFIVHFLLFVLYTTWILDKKYNS